MIAKTNQPDVATGSQAGTTQLDNVPVTAETPIGTRVRPSGYAIKPARDYWLSRGRHSEKSAAQAELDRLTAKRGTLTGLPKNSMGYVGATVQWDDGSESNCMLNMIVTAGVHVDGTKGQL